MVNQDHTKERTIGLLYAVAAYGWWGVTPPIYFKAVEQVPSPEILAHRIVWSLFLLLALLAWRRQIGEWWRCLRDWRILRMLLMTTFLIGLNWFVYVYAVVSNQIVQGSLGYFINPLINVVLGVVLFHERLRRPQLIAVALAAAGVALMTFAKGEIPWIALTLALAFGFYGLIRKQTPVDGVVGLSVEITLLFPLSLGYLIWLFWTGQAYYGNTNFRIDVLLILGSVITVVPLVCFGQAARMLPLTTLGFVQYLAPSAQFLIGVYGNNENLNTLEIVSFVFIWVALAIFSFDSVRIYRRSRIEKRELVLANDDLN